MDNMARLTPSEVELLKSNSGAEKILLGNLTRTLADETSSSLPLLEQIFIKALEANQAVGNFICQTQKSRSRFGLQSHQRVVIRVNGSHFTWPEPSLEASLDALVRKLSDGEDVLPFTDLVNAWFGEGAINHLQSALRWVYEALVERGWLRRKVEQRLELFRLTCYEIPARTRNLLSEDPGKNDSGYLGKYPESVVPAPAVLTRELEKELRRLNRMSR